MARTSTTIEQRVDALEQRMHVVESERPGRKPRPMLAIRQRDVCALTPSLNTYEKSIECPDASIYRYQSGCHGAACRLKQHNAYERRKDNKAVVVAPPRKRTSRTTTSPKTKPEVTKRAAKKAPPTKSAPARKAPPTKKAAPTPAKTRVPAKAVAKKAPTKAVAPTPIKRTAKATKTASRPAKSVSKRPSAA